MPENLEHYRCTIAAYMKEYRMNAAAVMLKSTQDSVISVANRVGYSNPGKFAAAFKNVLGVTPTEYRKSFFSGIKLTFIV